ncbi:Mechanosensitive ion channel family protein [Rhynchospora pubera]|uniref:Mechanosensitive ion channel protein n=1 Tax=Rhynchospora pubera TaxID=906938 RepID=A0AAV8H2R7_9POAL|nr:Mechanosensitive ion channel family protein [Rhynchospora pubera]
MDAPRKSGEAYDPQKHLNSSMLNRRQEQLPILPEQERNEVVVKIDGNSHNPFENTPPLASSPSNRVWRGGSYDFSLEDGVGNGGFSFEQSPTEDPPSRLISSFLRKRDATGATMSPAMDLEMDSLNKGSSIGSDSKENRSSFQDASAHSLPRHSHDCFSSSSDEEKKNPSGGARGAGEVLRCTSNSSLNRSSSLLRTKTRSRLMDPPPAHPSSPVKNADQDRKSGRPPLPRSGQLKSGPTGTKSGPADEEDDDLFMDSDIPDEMKKAKFDVWTVLQWLGLILIIGALVCSLVIPRLARQTVWSLHLWKWEVLVLTLICGRLVSGWLVRVAVFLIERNFLLRKRVLYFVYGVKSAVQNCLWLGLVLISWHFLFDRRTSHSPVLPYVSKILLCLLVATILRLIKTLLLKVLAASFHVSTYFDRIQEALFNQYVIETLSGPHVYEDNQTLVEVQRLQKAGATMPIDLQATALPAKNSGQVSKGIRFSRALSGNKRDEGITIDQLHKLNQRNISAWNMKRLMRIVRYGALTTLDERIPQIAVDMEDESSKHILSEQEAKMAARKIFFNVAKPGAKYIYFQDLLRFMREEEATKSMNLFEGAHEHKRISRRALKNWVVNAFRERKALALTLNDTKTAVNKLHQMANVVVGVIVFALWLLILGIATTHFFVFLSSQVLLAVFIFGNTLKTLFEALIFLFVMHPFDVGDRCEVEGVQLVVEEMNIMSTVFLRYDNLKIYYPNSVLATKPISNYYRSPDMGDSIDFAIHVATPLDKIAKMKERIIQFMENKKEHWYPGAQVVLRDVEDTNKLTVSIWMRQRINYQDMGTRFERRELVVQEMIRVLRELDIEYRMLPVDVNVRNLPPVNTGRLPSTWSSVN